jgi:hypothetical protein
MIRPWGCVQSYCCILDRKTRSKFKNNLPVIPLIDSSSKNPSPQDVKGLQDRLDALEIFLREYIVDVNYLDSIKEMDQNKEDDGKRLPPVPNNRYERESSINVIQFITQHSPNVIHQYHPQQPNNLPPPRYPESTNANFYNF